MICKIDQSGKIEKSNRVTVVACANGEIKSLQISAVEKQKLIQIMRIESYPKRTYVYKIFATLIFILLSDSDQVSEIIIDREYVGQEPTIKNFIIQLYNKSNKKVPEIRFGTVDKKSMAHKTAISVFRGERKPDVIVKAEQVLNFLLK